MNSFKIGIASVTFRNKTPAQVVEIAEKTGVGYIEWGADVHVKNISEAEKVKKLCSSKGIKISSYGSYYRTGKGSRDEWENILKIAHTMGAESIRIWLGDKNSEDTDEKEYRELLDELDFLCTAAEKYSLLVCPECHDNTFNNNTYAFLKLKSDLNKNNFRTYFQSRYFRYDYDIDRIEKTFDFIENVHISYRDLVREQRFRKKDRNYLDRLLKKLLEMNFSGIIMIEFTKGAKDKNFIKDIEKLRSY